MKCASIIPALLGVAACVAQAASEEDICKSLSRGLAEEEQVLAGVQDAATAAAAVPELQRVLAELSALHGQGDSTSVWLHIENTPELKNELIERLLKLAVQFRRLQKERFYGNNELGALLAPQLKPAAAAAK
ncbi:MAG: hypothetical protein Q4F38_08400 [Akkermansia sp.]|nr:hypothetical protein [Akkermansia sp.]